MKKIISLALVLALCLTFFPVMASAEESETTTETADTSWYIEKVSEFHLTTASQLEGLSQLVNSGTTFEDKTVYLDEDINLAGINWTPIGNSFADALFGGTDYRVFSGNFDGKGHTISNVTIGTESEPLAADVFGLFGATAGKISNLNLDNVSINGVAENVSGYIIGLAGALAGSAGGTVENCHVINLSMSINTPSNDYLGAYWIGGLVGALGEEQRIEGCSTSGTIEEKSGRGSIGGFIGELGAEATIAYSSANVALNVKSNLRGGVAGGFIGKGNGDSNEKTVISNCYATGNVTGGAYIGGFAGSLKGLNIKNCYTTGNVTEAAASMASFVGTENASGSAHDSIENCYAAGGVIGNSVYIYAFASQDAMKRSKITNCYFVDTNSNIKKQYESAIEKSLDAMKTEEFAQTLNDNDETNGWIYKEDRTPLCGAESADYSAVETALGKIPSDLTSYTEESVAALNEAKSNVVTGKMVVKQAEVNKMAEDIEKAIKALTLKDADYSKVDEAIAKANALNKSDYKDFTKVEEAIRVVVRGKKSNEQAEVDAMAQKINDAIAALEKKPSSSSSGSSRPRYDVTTPSKPENGSVTVDPERARSGSRVTVTVTPDSGYKLGELVVTDKDGKKLELTDKGNGQYTFTMPSGKVEVAAEFVKEVEVSPFADVATDAYYYDAVKWAVNKGITNGVSETLFGPDQACTRAQIVTFLWRAAGSPEPKSGSSFADVAADAYYAKAVAWAVENGITKGTSETTFHPDETCTRAQGVTFLYRALGKLAAAQAGFTDVAADSYYADAVNWAAENGVTNGISETLFGPDGSCTRAQIVTFLYRAYQGK